MRRKHWVHLGPALMVGAGIVAATLVASLATEHGCWVLAAPLLLALVAVGADRLRSRLGGVARGASATALLLTGAILLAGLIVAFRDPAGVTAFLPVIGAAAWAVLLPHARNRHIPCANLGSNERG